MKTKHKYNIGDNVWIRFSNAEPTKHKIVGLHISVNEDYAVSVLYKLDGLPLDIIGFTEDDCFLTKEECMKGKHNEVVKGTAIRMSGVLLRLLLPLSVFVLSLPIMAIQFIHWFLTGRIEPFTYRLMTNINNKLFR